ncbi:MAG: HYR domain-containing protein, partial [Acidobacteriota bacterium]|nr:HYR domain-containing protein [Acidobacteriota bacterium]
STDPGTCSANINPGTATATDNCGSPTVTGTRSDGQALNAPYPKGTTTITWTATDASGNSSSCTQTITVNDNEAPAITCPANITHGTDPGTCSANINPGTATATDNCDNPTVTGTRSDGQALNAPYPRGTTTITWTATDSSGNSSSCTQTITVNDTEAPTFTFTGTQSMWPPNHKYHTFGTTDLVTSIHDNCDGNIALSSAVIIKVTSDEVENGNGDGNTLNDIVIAPDCKSVQLRSEREGGGNGRVYTIYFRVSDAAGNVGTASTTVVVRHNPGEPAVDSGPHYSVCCGGGTCP